MKGKKNTPIYIVALMLFLAGVGWLFYAGFSENSVYFLNVSEVMAAPREKLGKIRMFGTVAAASLEKRTDVPGVSFTLEDKDDRTLTVRVVYKGAVPDAFKPGAEVIVEGGLEPDGHFQARTLMTKCPSKYQKENRS